MLYSHVKANTHLNQLTYTTTTLPATYLYLKSPLTYHANTYLKHTLPTTNILPETYLYNLPSYLTSIGKTLPELEVIPELKEVVLPDKAPEKRRRYVDAPILNLKDLLPEGILCPDAYDKSLDSKFRASRLEFVLLGREDPDTLDEDAEDEDLEWGIPDRDVFDEAIAAAIYDFTKDNEARIHSLDWSSTGWETGVGLVSMSTKDMDVVNDFRNAVANIELDGQRLSLIHI